MPRVRKDAGHWTARASQNTRPLPRSWRGWAPPKAHPPNPPAVVVGLDPESGTVSPRRAPGVGHLKARSPDRLGPCSRALGTPVEPLLHQLLSLGKLVGGQPTLEEGPVRSCRGILLGGGEREPLEGQDQIPLTQSQGDQRER